MYHFGTGFGDKIMNRQRSKYLLYGRQLKKYQVLSMGQIQGIRLVFRDYTD
jgi:hypothetical protein